MRKIYLFLLLTLFGLLSFMACDDTITADDLDKITIPSSNVSFSKYIQPLLQQRCNLSSCHNTADRAAGLSLETHYDVTSNSLIVFPGVPDNSKLVWAIEGRSISPMPPVGYRPLTSNQISGIKTWIKEGAKNN